MNEWIIKHKNKAVNVQSSDGKFRSLTAVKERATWLPGGTAADTSVSVVKRQPGEQSTHKPWQFVMFPVGMLSAPL